MKKKEMLNITIIIVGMLLIMTLIYKEAKNIEEYPDKKLNKITDETGNAIESSQVNSYIKEEKSKYYKKKVVNFILEEGLNVEILLIGIRIIATLQKNENEKTRKILEAIADQNKTPSG